MPKIPAGWEYWTSEREFDDAWNLAVEYKITQERAHCGRFIRVKVVKAAGVHWILRRIEERQESAA